MTLAHWLWAVPVFGLMIFVHELGHFAAAKFFGIRVHEFALGFGPSVLRFAKGGTRYSLRAVPLGGFVRMAGMDPDEPEDPAGFSNKPVYARALTILAGPLMNFLLASLLLSAFAYARWAEAPVIGQPLAECGGQPCPVAVAGLQPGDLVLEIDGEPVGAWSEVRLRVAGSGGAPLEVRLARDGRQFSAVLTPVQVEGEYVLGIRQATPSVWRALAWGPAMTCRYAGTWIGWLVDTVTGRQPVELYGPVGMTRAIATEASAGVTNLLALTAALSINLGLFNLLPIPALDGAHLLFMAVEAVRGRRLDPEFVGMAHFFGLLLLVGLTLVVTYGDLRAAILGS
ncbi:M50 family metallopeptidase [Symbiobacterium terraclitae]|uniref:M50 family metallopeptidase n=1 Tax=Symbiobacterium terraclitae TaxID=557451 RepID=UPI0035B51BB0